MGSLIHHINQDKYTNMMLHNYVTSVFSHDVIMCIICAVLLTYNYTAVVIHLYIKWLLHL